MKRLLLALLPAVCFGNVQYDHLTNKVFVGQSFTEEVDLAQCANVSFVNCTFQAGRFGLRLNGCKNIQILNCSFIGDKDTVSLLESTPGDPNSFKDEAAKRGVRWVDGRQYAGGTNLRGHIGQYKDTNRSGVGLGSSLVTIPFNGMVVLDPFTLPKNVWQIFVNGKTLYCQVVSVTATSVVLRAPEPVSGPFTWFTYNEGGYSANLTVRGCQFLNAGGSLASFYCVRNLVFENNSGLGGDHDGFTFEMTLGGRVTGNVSLASQPIAGQPGNYYRPMAFHGQTENVSVAGNVGEIQTLPHGQPVLNTVK